ncbi:MAG: hypothetical protein AAF541_06285 [Pseudomonadota bacterium]
MTIMALLHGCASSVDTHTSPPQPPSKKENLPADQLCIIGREVRSVSQDDCGTLQASERQGQGWMSRMLNRIALEYDSQELTLDLLEGVSLGASYKYGVEPSYRDSYFTRIDAYNFSRDFHPASLLGDLPLGINFSRSSQLLFAQQFASGATARDPRSTYLPTKVPVTPERALALKTGDYVRFNTNLQLLANAGQVWPIGGFALKLEAGYALLLEGEYEIHLFRLDDHRVRLRLVAQRRMDRSLSGEVRTSGLTSAILNRIDARLEPVTKLAQIDARAGLARNRTKTELFLVDYTLDLADPEVRAAFGEIFKPTITLKDVSIANPLRGRFSLKDRLVGTIEPLDELARIDYENESPRVTRHFQAVNYSRGMGLDFTAKISRFEVSRSRMFRENFLARKKLTDQGETHEYYLLPTWSQFRSRSMLFGMLDENQIRSADALFVADAQGKPVRFLNIGFSLSYKDAALRPSEYRKLRQKIELLLPDQADAALATQLQGTRWLDDHFRRNVALDLNYLFRESALDDLVANGYGQEEKLRLALTSFIVKSIEAAEFPLFEGSITDLINAQDRPTNEQFETAGQAAAYSRWQEQIDRVTQSLALAFTAGQDTTKRMQAVLELRRLRFYQRVGTAFWVDLVDQAGIDISESMYLVLNLSADEHLGLVFEFGAPGERALYDSVRLIQTLLNDRTLDMREPGVVDNIISRMTILSN